ncbi:sarcoplasmic reticulum histidine-rich calcium-binding protein-like [Electrophorus electricus]|uniref:sarcoplasmic reticulum histidine-rich calcium-binding protein-like n=1 Tax=Electrophorus electricus TaxID=8005 RepID=UPI0015D016CB|nr:sarcoplasmic reticulum histidine-rich calcium-binding protein-like [Electrophorus electricus]
MQLRVDAEVLAVLAVLFLAPSVTEGVVLNKCELRNQMKMVLPANLLNSNELAKIVCHVQLTSGFNTSMVKSMNETEDEPSVSIHPSTKDHKMSGQTEHQEDDDDDDKGNHPGGRKSRSVKSVHIVPTKPSASNFTSNHTSTKDHKMAGQTEHQEDEEDDKGNHPRGRKSRSVKSVHIVPTKPSASNFTSNHTSTKDHKMAGQTEHQEDEEDDKGNHPRGRKSRGVKSVHIDPTKPSASNFTSNHTSTKDHKMAGQTEHQEDEEDDKGNHPRGRKSRGVKSVHIDPTKPSASNFTSNHTSTKDHKMAGQTEHQEDDDDDDKGNHPRGRKSRDVKSVHIDPTKPSASNFTSNHTSTKDHKMAGQTEHQEDEEDDKGNHPRGRKSRGVKSVHIDPTKPPASNITSNHTSTKDYKMAGQTEHQEDDAEDKGNHPRGRKSRAVKSVHIDPTQPLVFNLLSNKTTSKEHRIAGQTKPHEDDGDKGNHLGSEEDEVWTFYGLFQLSDHVACVSGNNTSLNLCGMSCDNLRNGNISDDIDCVGTIIKTTREMENSFKPSDELTKQMTDLLQCDSVVDSQYFAGC